MWALGWGDVQVRQLGPGANWLGLGSCMDTATDFSSFETGYRRSGGGISRYNRATSALRRAQEEAAKFACRVVPPRRVGTDSGDTEPLEGRRLQAAYRYAEAVWQVEADRLMAARSDELGRRVSRVHTLGASG